MTGERARRMKQDFLKSGLKALYYSQAHRLLAPATRGVGLIYMLHRVSPDPVPPFAPNGILTVRPEFLDAVIGQARESGLDVITLDEARERVLGRSSRSRFVCFTLDDGYRDNLEHALPVFQKHRAPCTIYVPSRYADGTGELWWVALERIIERAATLEVDLGDGRESVDCSSLGAKQAAFHKVYWWLRQCGEDVQRDTVRALCGKYGVDQSAICRELIMSWDELRKISRDPLVTIGAHTVNHLAVGKLSKERARSEMEAGAERLAGELGERPRHFSFPYGDARSAGPRDFALARELGFDTAVTTRKGVLFPEHAEYLTALPRVSLNGAFQSLIYTQLYLTGAPFALWNKFRRVDAD